MTVSFTAPLERAWARTRRMLFAEFRPEKWLVVGFAAFLAGLVGGWASLGLSPGRGLRWTHSLDNIVISPGDIVMNSMYNRLWSRGFASMILALIVTVALLWISSRGKFVFLENAIYERGAIGDPWRRYSHLGDSLFFWRLGFALALLLVFGAVLSPMILVGMRASPWDDFGFLGAMARMGATLFGLAFAIVAAYVALFLEGFVVPLMYRDEISATRAWRKLWPLLQQHPAELLAFGLIVFAAWLLVAACIMVIGFATCCLLFFVVSIPYVSSVVLLPVTTVFRLYTLEFMEQFGDDYRILSTPPGDTPTDPDDSGP